MTPDDVDALAARGQAYEELGDDARASADYTRVLKSRPQAREIRERQEKAREQTRPR